MKKMTVSKVRTNLYKILEEISKNNNPLFIEGKSGNAILIPEKKWKMLINQGQKNNFQNDEE